MNALRRNITSPTDLGEERSLPVGTVVTFGGKLAAQESK